MFSIEIYIDYYNDNTCYVKEININNQVKRKFDKEKNKIDLSILKGYEGYVAKLFCNYIDEPYKNSVKHARITKLEQDKEGSYILHYDVL